MDNLADKFACTEVIQRWGLCRDQGKWADLPRPSRPTGRSRCPGSAARLHNSSTAAARVSKRGSARSITSCRRWCVSWRARHRRDLDRDSCAAEHRRRAGRLTSHGRFLDRLERRDGRWAIRERCAIYERDRLDPVEPSEAFDKLFKTSDFAAYPAQYRYMAARLAAVGRALAPVVHRDGEAETAELYARYEDWLAGR